MADYIDREKLLAKIDEAFFETDPDGKEQIGVLKCRAIIREIPAADVAPEGWISVKDKLLELEPQLDIEAVTTEKTKAEQEAFDFLRRRFNQKNKTVSKKPARWENTKRYREMRRLSRLPRSIYLSCCTSSAKARKGEPHDTLAMGARGVYPRRLAWHLDNGRHYRREPRR
jgi:hypothetical protein